MNLLPKNRKEFVDKSYWNSFFKNRGNKEFEWYGEYPELCGYLHKYIKSKDKILVIGCGNSKLSADLYDVGYRQITNIDISSVVINQMKQGNKERPELIFKQMDVLDMKFEENEFSVVLDKGTLDALVPDETEEDLTRGETLFNQVDKVLKIGGRYIIISLLQSHILKLILNYFVDCGWMIRICRCFDVEVKSLVEDSFTGMPVFFVICTKFKKNDKFKSILEENINSEDKIERLETKEQFLELVKNAQNSAVVCSGISKGNLEEEICLDLCKNNKVKYTIYVNDDPDKKNINKFAVFIVPHGRETEWMFRTTAGRLNLIKKCGYDRMAIVTLHRDNEYGDMQEIQDELRLNVLQLAPKNRNKANNQSPYLTVGDNVGHRTVLHRGSSEISGEYVVEDVTIDQHVFRRLVFLSNIAVVQSEVRMRTVKKKNKVMQVIDKDYIACGYHTYMLLSAVMCHGDRFLILGVGGGNLLSHLRRLLPDKKLAGVDLDPEIIDLAKVWFGLETEHMNIVADDGLLFVSKCADCSFDMVVLDVDSKEQGVAMTFPPRNFVTDEAIVDYRRILSDKGMLVLNVACRDIQIKNELIKKLKIYFPLVWTYQLDEDINQIVFCFKDKTFNVDLLKTSVNKLNTLFKRLMKHNNDPLIDLNNLLSNMCFVDQ